MDMNWLYHPRATTAQAGPERTGTNSATSWTCPAARTTASYGMPWTQSSHGSDQPSPRSSPHQRGRPHPWLTAAGAATRSRESAAQRRERRARRVLGASQVFHPRYGNGYSDCSPNAQARPWEPACPATPEKPHRPSRHSPRHVPQKSGWSSFGHPPGAASLSRPGDIGLDSGSWLPHLTARSP